MTNISVATAPKTSFFQMRINPEVKQLVEDIYAQCGMTLTDAINIFIQQSINADGMPMIITTDSKEAVKQQAIGILMSELKKGEETAKSLSDYISQDEIKAEFGIK